MKLLKLAQKVQMMTMKEQKGMIGMEKDQEQMEKFSIEFINYALDMGKKVSAKEKLDQKDQSQQVNFMQ